MCYCDHHKATRCTVSRKFCHSPYSTKIFPLFQSERKLQRLHLIDVVDCWPWSHTTWLCRWWPVVICSLIMLIAHHGPPSPEITGKSEVGAWVIHISSAGFVWLVPGWESGCVCYTYLWHSAAGPLPTLHSSARPPAFGCFSPRPRPHPLHLHPFVTREPKFYSTLTKTCKWLAELFGFHILSSLTHY